jgi:HEAT repeat protein
VWTLAGAGSREILLTSVSWSERLTSSLGTDHATIARRHNAQTMNELLAHLKFRRARLLLLPILFTLPAGAAEENLRQDGHDSDDQEFRAEAPERPQDMPLAELPEPPSLSYPAPRPEAVEAIDRLLDQVTGEDESIRQQASQTLLEAKSDWVGGIARRIEQLREASEPTQQKALLSQMREKTSERLRSETGKSGESPDYLNVALEHANPSSSTWRVLTQLLALSRMLSAIGTLDSTREIIHIYQRFGEYMRIDCQRQLDAMGDLSTAGLIEAQRNPATNVAEWAKRLLRLSGKTDPQKIVHTDDDRALSEILIALGRNQDPDSAPILISFASTERAQIRRAARQGLVLMGEVSAWQLKDAYLNTTGKHPPREWTWKRTARELFTEFDRLHLARAYALYDEAEKARKAKNLEKMKTGYDQVLALNPAFDKKATMAEGYLSYASSVQATDRPAALLALRRAERVAPTEELRNVSRGRRNLLEAENLKEKGILDRTLIESAISLNPTQGERAKTLLESNTQVQAWGKNSRYFVAGVTALLALLGAAWILFTSRRQTNIPNPSTPNASENPKEKESEKISPAVEDGSPGSNEKSAP